MYPITDLAMMLFPTALYGSAVVTLSWIVSCRAASFHTPARSTALTFSPPARQAGSLTQPSVKRATCIALINASCNTPNVWSVTTLATCFLSHPALADPLRPTGPPTSTRLLLATSTLSPSTLPHPPLPSCLPSPHVCTSRRRTPSSLAAISQPGEHLLSASSLVASGTCSKSILEARDWELSLEV